MNSKPKTSQPIEKTVAESTQDESKSTPLKTDTDKSYRPPQIELLGNLDELTQESGPTA